MPDHDLVILDFDGTLADSAGWLFATVNLAARRFGFRAVAVDEVERLRALGARRIMSELGIAGWKLPSIARWMRARALADADRIRLFPGAGEALGALRARGVRLAIASSNGEAHIRTVLGSELAGLIDDWGCGASLFGKARVLRRLVRRAPGARAIYVGDEVRDIEAAHAARIASGAALWGFAVPQALLAARPTRTLASIADLATL